MKRAQATGLERIGSLFDRLLRKQIGGLATYIVAGDPDLTTTARLLAALPRAGADLIELGFPFSDPLAEGTAIQAAHNRALLSGTRVADIFELVRAWRRSDWQTPLLLMGYLNPILQYGPEKFVADAANCGVDGLIIVDLPHESADLIKAPCSARGLATVLMVAPSTSDERAELITRASTGLVYCAATSGTTGSQRIDVELTRRRVERLRLVASTPVGVGFGIQTPEDVCAVRQFADLAIVGSVLVGAIANAASNETVEAGVRLTQALSGSQTWPAMSKA